MMVLNALLRLFSGARITRVFYSHKRAAKVQRATLRFLLKHGAKTVWGRDHSYTKKLSYKAFVAQTPISTYESLFPYIERTLQREKDVLWPGSVKYFAKSSGTTNDRSKYIPLTEDNIQECHFRGGKDMILLYLERYQKTTFLLGKTVGVGGSFDITHPYGKEVIVGDLSAVIMKELPFWVRHRRTPSLQIATIPSWEEKLTILAKESMKKDIRAIAGVPSWTHLLLKKVLELSGKKSLYDVWPNLEVFFHGGVSLDPYRSMYHNLLGDNFHYEEIYNASEGFFAIQDNPHRPKEMLLMLDYHVFYEFILLEDVGKENPPAYTIDTVSLHTPYALIISTSSGLWRYAIGDVVSFVSLAPYRITVVGRTAHAINIFGEELMVANTDQALHEICVAHDAEVSEYTVAPYVSPAQSSGYHEWVVEFIKPPKNKEVFTAALDVKLRTLNSDYDAKRTADMILAPLVLHDVPHGSFYNFMKRRNRLGGQNKVPRLSHERKHIELLLNGASLQ